MNVLINRADKNSKISLQIGSEIAIVTIHRPRFKNALNASMWKDMHNIIKEVKKRPKVKVVILRGVGNNFSAGSDLKEFNEVSSAEEADYIFQLMENALSALERLLVPTIAIVNGPAFGAGLQLALTCDLRIGTSETLMGMPLGKLGITISNKFTKRIVDLIGPSRMKDLIYTNRFVHPEEAHEWGLINYLLKEEDSNRYALEIAEKIKHNSISSLKAAKEAAAHNIPEFYLPTEKKFESNIDSDDFFEGVQAFIEKRKPKFIKKEENKI